MIARPFTLAVLVLLLAGCAPSPATLGEMGCRTIDEYLPELDSFRDGALTDEESADLWDRAKEEIRLGYFDNETGGLFNLLTDSLADSQDDSFTPVDVDYADMRYRAITYCESDIGWSMTNG